MAPAETPATPSGPAGRRAPPPEEGEIGVDSILPISLHDTPRSGVIQVLSSASVNTGRRILDPLVLGGRLFQGGGIS